MKETHPSEVLEAGCGNGLNLQHIAPRMRFAGTGAVYGIDTSDDALALARERMPSARVSHGDICAIPYRDARFDLVISCTVLQHLGDADCAQAIRELYRVSRMWILVMEYDATERTPVAWRGSPEGILKRPWASMLNGTFKSWGALGEDQGFDDVSWWLVKK